MATLIENKEWLDSQRAKLFETYANKYLVIVEKAVVQAFDHYDAAANFAIENYGVEGGFLIEFLSQEEPINFVLAANI